MPRSFNGRTSVFEAEDRGSNPWRGAKMSYEPNYSQTNEAAIKIMALLAENGVRRSQALWNGIAEIVDDALSDYADGCWDSRPDWD